MLQQSCRFLQGYCSTYEHMLLQGYFSCNKIEQSVNFIAAFILFYFLADVRTRAIHIAIYFIAALILFYCK